MTLGGFVDTGADMNTVNDLVGIDEHLNKALDKSKLVQVQTTVNGKNGTYTRMQWKKASDVDPKKDVIVGGNTDAADKKPAQKKDDGWKRPSKIGDSFSTSMANRNGTPMSLSNICFGLSEKVRQEKYSKVASNIGYNDQVKVINHIIANSGYSAEALARALNNSGVSYTNWVPEKTTDDEIVVKVTDRLGNEYKLWVNPREKANKSSAQFDKDKKMLEGKTRGNEVFVKYNGRWAKARKINSPMGGTRWEVVKGTRIVARLSSEGLAKMEVSETDPNKKPAPAAKPKVDAKKTDAKPKTDADKAKEMFNFAYDDDTSMPTKVEEIKVGDKTAYIVTRTVDRDGGDHRWSGTVYSAVIDGKKLKVDDIDNVVSPINLEDDTAFLNRDYCIAKAKQAMGKPAGSGNPDMGKTIKVGGTKSATIKEYNKLSQHEKREGADGFVDYNGTRYDYYGSIMANGVGSLVPHKDDPKVLAGAKNKVGDKGAIRVGSETIPVKILEMTTLNGKVQYRVQEDRPFAGSATMRKYWVGEVSFKSLDKKDNKKPDTKPAVPKDFKQFHDDETNETWYEGKRDGHDIRILQEKVGSDKWWNVDIDRRTLKDGNYKPMSFANLDDASDEIDAAIADMKNNKPKSDAKPQAPAAVGQKLSAPEAKAKVADLHKQLGSNDAFIAKAKELGVTWTENANAGINLMRAKMAMSKAIENGLDVGGAGAAPAAAEGGSKPTDDKKPAGKDKTVPAANKANSQASKDKVAELHKQLGSNDAFLNKAKELGVKWTESDKAGINLMRAKMAMAKAIDGGLDVNGSSDKPADDKTSGNSSKSQKVIDDFDSAMSNKPSSVDDFLKSDVFKQAKNLYKRMEKIDELQGDVATDDGAYDNEWKELKTRFEAAEDLYDSLCKKLPGGNWSTLPSGSPEREKAVDEWDKSENTRAKADKVFNPDVTHFNHYNFDKRIRRKNQ